ncbi:MAG TPA: hypothetical protein PLC04_07670, partial [Candidatus Kapabacteria bacterium]|nr:hypothetical protein [Candidatus Kapabacteria bacterium]
RNLHNQGIYTIKEFTQSRMIVPLFMYLDHRGAESLQWAEAHCDKQCSLSLCRGLKPTVAIW